MDRLTERRGDMVYFRKDGNLLAPLYMSGTEVRQALQRLSEYEDGAVATSESQIGYAYHQGFMVGHQQCYNELKKEEMKPLCAYCGGRYTVVDNDHNKYVADGEVKYCFHCGRRL